jgi:hypothetical protein
MQIQTGVTDRRLALEISEKITAKFGNWGGYFCFLLISLPILYPAQKQLKHRLRTAIISAILMAWPSFPKKPVYRFLKILGGLQCPPQEG